MMVRRLPYLLSLLLVVSACTDDMNQNDSDASESRDAAVETVTDQSSADGVDASGWLAVDSELASEFQAALERAVASLETPGAGMGVAYADGHSVWSGAAGLSRVESSETWEPERSFRIGSVTKTFTAAVVFQLIEEGVLGLDDPLEDWVPGYYDGVGVTLRHLLSNTSGIVSYNYVGSFDDSRPWMPVELADWAVLHEPSLRFEPGSQWEYSNTNWVLLGLAIEAGTGGSYEEAIESRLLEPLELTSTYVAQSGDANPAIVDCYDALGANLTDAADPSFGWAAGAMVSTPSDLARWGVALYGGNVLRPESLALMLTQTVLTDGTTVEDYGLGAFIERDEGAAIFGHTGGIAGYLTYLYFWETDRIALVVVANQLETNLRTLAGYGWSVALDFEFP